MSTTYNGYRIVPKWTADGRAVKHYVIRDRSGDYVAMAPSEAEAKRVIDRLEESLATMVTSRYPRP